MATLVAKLAKSPSFLRNFAVLRPDLQSSKFLIWNCAPVFVQLSDRCNILPVNTVKTVSSPPSPDLSPDNKKQEKQSRTRQKTVKVNAGISEHDLKIKMTHMSEWLEKGYHVSVLILKTSYRPEAGEKLFSQMVNAFKDTAAVKHAQKTATSTRFELQPTSKHDDAKQSDNDAKTMQFSTVDKPFKLDELQKLRSEAGSADIDTDKS